MSSYVTLRGLLGLGDEPAALRDSALIMIDCQNTYRRGVMQLEGAEDAFAEAARLLARARASGVPVFHVMHDAGQGSPYDITAEIGQISSEVAPVAGEPIVVKHYPSSFFQTDLDAQLGKTGLRDLVLTGFMTHMCVSSTARDAFNLGYRPTIVTSATATRELPVPGGVPVPATTLQSATLAGIADLFALVVGEPDDLPRLTAPLRGPRTTPTRIMHDRYPLTAGCLGWATLWVLISGSGWGKGQGLRAG